MDGVRLFGRGRGNGEGDAGKTHNRVKKLATAAVLAGVLATAACSSNSNGGSGGPNGGAQPTATASQNAGNSGSPESPSPSPTVDPNTAAQLNSITTALDTVQLQTPESLVGQTTTREELRDIASLLDVVNDSRNYLDQAESVGSVPNIPEETARQQIINEISLSWSLSRDDGTKMTEAVASNILPFIVTNKGDIVWVGASEYVAENGIPADASETEKALLQIQESPYAFINPNAIKGWDESQPLVVYNTELGSDVSILVDPNNDEYLSVNQMGVSALAVSPQPRSRQPAESRLPKDTPITEIRLQGYDDIEISQLRYGVPVTQGLVLVNSMDSEWTLDFPLSVTSPHDPVTGLNVVTDSERGIADICGTGWSAERGGALEFSNSYNNDPIIRTCILDTSYLMVDDHTVFKMSVPDGNKYNDREYNQKLVDYIDDITIAPVSVDKTNGAINKK
jgi:hypothetical protein